MKLYVGNLPPTYGEDDLRELFSSIATPKSAKLIVDHATGRSKCFGFVEFNSKDEGMQAIKELDGKVIGNSPIVVNEARPQEKRENNRGGAGAPFKKRY
jgi:RNA recognition motif-containing protein